MNDVDCFTLFLAANDFLSHDYEHCLKVCSTRYKGDYKNTLFKGNILKLKALALEETYIQ